MRLTHRTGRFVAPVALAGFLAAGCASNGPQGSSSPPPSENLTDVAGLLRDYTAEFNKGPSKLADMAKHETLYSRGYQAIKSGDVAVVWGVPMPNTGGGTGVIAYEKKVETVGGYVLLLSGEIKEMTANEFAAAPKAK